LQSLNPALDIFYLGFGALLDMPAGCARRETQGQQLFDLLERKPKFLGALDEEYSVDRGRRIGAVAGVQPRRLLE